MRRYFNLAKDHLSKNWRTYAVICGFLWINHKLSLIYESGNNSYEIEQVEYEIREGNKEISEKIDNIQSEIEKANRRLFNIENR